MIAKLKKSLLWPASESWRQLFINLAWLAPLLLLVGFAGGLMQWAPQFDLAMLKLAAIAVIIPSLGEELLFRAAILPKPEAEAPLPIKWMVLSTLMFVLWHPIQAPIYGGAFGAMMLNPWFLVAVALTGFACARLYWETRSIWPAVALHWIVIMAWKALLDGPSPWTTA